MSPDRDTWKCESTAKWSVDARNHGHPHSEAEASGSPLHDDNQTMIPNPAITNKLPLEPPGADRLGLVLVMGGESWQQVKGGAVAEPNSHALMTLM
jgi:hypothetical protein